MTIRPFEHELCARPQFGRNVNCVAIDEDNWMICGGGPKLSMWHLRSMKPMSVLEPFSSYMAKVCVLNENEILTGGNKNCLYTYSFDNKLKSEITTSTSFIYDVAINNASKSNKVMSIAGNGCSLDLCINFAYRSFSLTF